MRVRQADAPRCWARRDDAPPFDRDGGQESAWAYACLRPARSRLGLCARHRKAIFGPAAKAAKGKAAA